MNICCCGGSDAVVEPSSSGSSSLGRSSSRRSKFNFRKMKSALQIGSSSYEEDLMFIIYCRPHWYEIKAFNQKGKRIPPFCFTIDMSVTSLPHNSGFCSVRSTLYMIGGAHAPTSDSCDGYVPTVHTYQLDFHTIPHFLNHLPPDHAQLGYVRQGPSLHAPKQAPIVIVAGYQIYVFNRFLLLDVSTPNFELLDTDSGREGEEQWTVLPEPPFQENLGIRDVDEFALEIVSHIFYEEQSSIIICVSGSDCKGVYNGVYEFLVNTRQWNLLSSETIPFFGKVVPLCRMYYAFRHPCRSWDNKVCAFVGSPAAHPCVEEMDNLESPPAVVGHQALCEMGLLGDTLFVARVGFDSMHDAAIPHFTLDKFQVTIKYGRAKAVKFRRKIYKLDKCDDMFCTTWLYCAPWVQQGQD